MGVVQKGDIVLDYIIFLLSITSINLSATVKATKIAAGLEPENTNLMLQKLAEAATTYHTHQ